MHILESKAEYQSIAGTDVILICSIPSLGLMLPIVNASTVSISTFRDTRRVDTLGRIGAAGYARGDRTIAGSIILIDTFEHALQSFMRHIAIADSPAVGFHNTTVSYDDPLSNNKQGPANQITVDYREMKSILFDQLPPLDILMYIPLEKSLADNQEFAKRRVLYGVEFASEGQVYSANDIYSEIQLSYHAMECTAETITSIDTSAPELSIAAVATSSLSNDNKYRDYLIARNPYI